MRKLMMEAYSYHTSSRFGSRVKVSVEDGVVSVTGPRMGVTVYRIWLTIQGVLLAAIILAIVAGLILLSPWSLVLAVGLFALHILGCIGATAVWELMNLFGHETATFRVEEVKDFRRGGGWARGVPRILIPFYVSFMNRFSPGQIVSFEAPDEKTSGDVVYALMLWDEEDAARLGNLLGDEARR
jgi:hypothetical protein